MLYTRSMAWLVAAGVALSVQAGGPVGTGSASGPAGAQGQQDAQDHHHPPSHPLSPGDALDLLVAGNQRWADGQTTSRNTDPARLAQTASQGQQPFATIVACSDSRVPVERVFDRGVGDLFVVRVAGNVCDVDEVGSVEYGVAHLGTPVVVVLGHSACGAVTAVAQGAHVGPNIQQLVDNIKPAVEEARQADPKAQGQAFIEQAVAFNAFRSIHDLLTRSPDTCRLVEQGRLRIVAAVYDLHGGKIQWLGEHPRQSELVARTLQGSPQAGQAAAQQAPTTPTGHSSDRRYSTVPDRGH